jgi:hypothetical protein
MATTIPIIIGKYSFISIPVLGGGGGIRTPGTVSRTTVFKTVAIDHSATPPISTPLLSFPTDGRAGGTRTPNRRFWRPLLYQLSYRPLPPEQSFVHRQARLALLPQIYATMSDTRPAPIVRPPSRMANRCPFSIATGAINSISTDTLSPGITISTPCANCTVPVTSVVRK